MNAQQIYPTNWQYMNEYERSMYENGLGYLWDDNSWNPTQPQTGGINYDHGYNVGDYVYLSKNINRNGVLTPSGFYYITSINERNGVIYLNNQPVATQNMQYISKTTLTSGQKNGFDTSDFNMFHDGVRNVFNGVYVKSLETNATRNVIEGAVYQINYIPEVSLQDQAMGIASPVAYANITYDIDYTHTYVYPMANPNVSEFNYSGLGNEWEYTSIKRFNGLVHYYYSDTTNQRVILVTYYVNVFQELGEIYPKLVVNVVFPTASEKLARTALFENSEIENFQAQVKKYSENWQTYDITKTQLTSNFYTSITDGSQYGLNWFPSRINPVDEVGFVDTGSRLHNLYPYIKGNFCISYNPVTNNQQTFTSPCSTDEFVVHTSSIQVPIDYQYKIITPNQEYIFDVQETFNFSNL